MSDKKKIINLPNRFQKSSQNCIWSEQVLSSLRIFLNLYFTLHVWWEGKK